MCPSLIYCSLRRYFVGNSAQGSELCQDDAIDTGKELAIVQDTVPVSACSMDVIVYEPKVDATDSVEVAAEPSSPAPS